MVGAITVGVSVTAGLVIALLWGVWGAAVTLRVAGSILVLSWAAEVIGSRTGYSLWSVQLHGYAAASNSECPAAGSTRLVDDAAAFLGGGGCDYRSDKASLGVPRIRWLERPGDDGLGPVFGPDDGYLGHVGLG